MPEFSLPIINTAGTPLRILLEPWGDDYTIEPGGRFTLPYTGAGSCDIEMEHNRDGILFFAGSGAVLRLFDGAKELGAGNWPRQPAP